MAINTLEQDLQQWGPNSQQAPPPDFKFSREYCRRLATSHYENFPVASVFLPRRLRQHFFNVYAFCRWADDLGDEINDDQQSLELLDWWEQSVHDCYRGECRHPVFVALKPTIDQFHIPPSCFTDLISAFRQDQTVKSYETFDQLLDYCRRSANPVGRIVLHLTERVNEQNLAWSDSICTGLQLANFWQDVARDFAINRVYLPQEDMREFGVTASVLSAGVSTPEFRQLMEFQVNRARQFLHDGLPLVNHMPGRLRIVIDLFARGGLRILDEIQRIDYAVLEQRPQIRKSAFLKLALQAGWRGVWKRRKQPLSESSATSEKATTIDRTQE